MELRLREVLPGNLERKWAPGMSFGMWVDGVDQEVGGIRLRLGDSEELVLHAGQVGYEVEPAFRGQRLAAQALRLILPVAREAGMTELWVTCDPSNPASWRTIEIAGGAFVEMREIAESSSMRSSGRTQVCRYRFDLRAQ